MGLDFAALDSAVDMRALQADVTKAQEEGDLFAEVEPGTYIVEIEKMELGETKDHRPMFRVQCKIKEGEMANRKLFMNRVVYGTKNDGNMISGVLTWLDALGTETVPEFHSYSDFAKCILNIFQEVSGKVELEVEYDAKAWNTITIKEVYDL